MRLSARKKFERQAGLGMIEALVAMVIISLGLLGIAALQLSSLKQSSSAQWHSQAVWYSYEITDRIAANRGAFADYIGIDTNNAYQMDCMTNNCTAIQMVEADAQIWKEMVGNLPEGRGVITSPANQVLQIAIMWKEDAQESNCTNGEPDADNMTCYTVTIQ